MYIYIYRERERDYSPMMYNFSVIDDVQNVRCERISLPNPQRMNSSQHQ